MKKDIRFLPSREEMLELVGYFNQKKFNLVEENGKRLIKKYPRHPFGWKLLALAFKHSQKTEEAKRAIKHAIKLNTQDPEVFNILGSIFSDQEELEAAIIQYKRALLLRPDYAEAYNNLANAQQRLGLSNEALGNYLNAIHLNPRYAEAHNNLGSLYIKLKDYNNAEIECKKALEIRKNYPEALNNLGNIYNCLRDLKRAENAYRDALNISGQFYEAYNNLGATLQNQGRLAEAERALLKAIEIKPDYSDAHLNLALNYFFMHKVSHAKDHYKILRLIDINRNGLKASIDLGILEYLDEKYENASRYLNESQNIISRPEFEYKYYIIYWSYLLNLIKLKNASMPEEFEPNDKLLCVIGESHSLGHHGLKLNLQNTTYKCRSYWIPGCKQYHLGNEKANIFKTKFESILKELSNDSALLIVIGEIDCREDDGIISYLLKNINEDKNVIILTTVTSFLRYIKFHSAKRAVIIQGIPAPRLERLRKLDESHARLLCDLIQKFNDILRFESQKYDFGFLDVFSATNDCIEYSSGHLHIDDYHLLPSTLETAWLNNFVSPIGFDKNI